MNRPPVPVSRRPSHLTVTALLTLALSLPLVAGGVVRAATIEAHGSRIVEVTVFRDRAELVHEVRVDLPAGASTVELPGIPIGVEPDSLRVSAKGVPAVLGAVEIRDRADEPEETEEWIAARDDVRHLEAEIAALRAAGDVDDELRSFLGSIRAAAATNESTKLGEGKADPETISTVYTILRDRLGELSKGRLERADRERDLHEQLEVAKARLATVRPRTDIRSRVATVEIETRQAGALDLRLAYVAPGASWRPSYRASLDVASGEVNLVAEGVVRQNTGEDWSGVTLRLSTASPARGVEPPLLTWWILRPVVPVRVAAQREGYMEKEEADVGKYQNTLALSPGAAAAGEPAEGDIAVASLSRSAYNVSFEVPGRSDVPADGRDHRVVLRNETLAGNLVYRTVPQLAPQAYLTSVTTSPADYPLLAGPMRVFAGGAYLGSFPLEEKGPGVELTLPFGVDNRVEVVRLPQPKSSGRSGFGKQHEVEMELRTQVHNLQDHPVKLVLEDRLPVAEDERIVVEIGKQTTPGYKDSERRPGVKLWTVDLAAGEKREFVLAYTVRYPRDMTLPGIE